MRIKGTSIASFLAFLEAEYSAPRTKTFIATLDPDLRKRCEGLVLASAFYPWADLESLARKARLHFDAPPDFFERSGAFNASFALGGVYRALLARQTPFDFLKAAERSWSQFTDSGSARAEFLSDGKAVVTVLGLPMSAILCARVTGFLTKSLQLAGAQKISIKKARCTQRGDASCEWALVWDATLSPASWTQTSAIRRPVVI